MVNNGPSRACENCRKRHIRCDLTSPACIRCTKRGLVCPGYGHPLDVLLRTGKHKQGLQTIPRTQPTTSDESSLDIARHTTAMYREPFLGLDVIASDWFFLNFFRVSEYCWRSSHGHFDSLAPIYLASGVDSPLHSAVTWLGMHLMRLHTSHEDLDAMHSQLVQTTRAISAAISDELRRFQDDTLYAILLLHYGEELKSTSNRSTRLSSMHQKAAEVIVRARGAPGKDDEAYSSLFAAARHNATTLAFLDIDYTSLWYLWDDARAPDCELLKARSTPAMLLDAHCVTFLKLLFMYKQDNTRSSATFLHHAIQRLEHDLQLWLNSVPPEWQGVSLDQFHQQYPAPQIACLFAQLHLLLCDIHGLKLALEMIHVRDANNQQALSSLKIAIDGFIACTASCLGVNNLQRAAITAASDALLMPALEVATCHTSSRVKEFDLLLARFEHSLSRTAANASLDARTADLFQTRMLWVQRERHMIATSLK